MISKTLNFLAVQANWLACVLGAAWGLPWLGPLTTAVLIVEFVRRSRRRAPVLWLLLTAALMGLVVDSGLTIAGRLQFIEPTAGPWPPVAPPWIPALWLALATTPATLPRLHDYLQTGRIKLVARGLYAIVPPGQAPEDVHTDPFLVAVATRHDPRSVEPARPLLAAVRPPGPARRPAPRSVEPHRPR